MNIEIVEALDKLNSWVRSKSYRHGAYSGARRMVYFMKKEVLWHGFDLKMEHRGIVVAVRCRDCGGSGRYVDSYGCRYDHCWACNSSGTACLQFIETKIEDQITWHTPREQFPWHWEGDYQIEVGYAPNQNGNDLEPWEAAQYLNRTEPCFRRPHDYTTSWSCTAFNDFNYCLWVGRTEETCEFCGRVDQGFGMGYCCTRNRIGWAAHACRECDKKLSNRHGKPSIFEQFAFPYTLTAHPEIQRWMERHYSTNKGASHES